MPSVSSAPDTKLTSASRLALAGLSLSMLLSSLGTSISNVALPAMAEAFSASFQQVQWIVLAYLLAITALIVSVGRLGDLIGRRRLLLSGLAVFTVASLLCAMAPSLWLLIAARAVQGLGAAIMMALTMAFVSDIVPRHRTGSAMGLLGTMSAVGTALGPSLGGLLIAGFGWRAIFFVNLPLGVLAFFLAYRLLPSDPRSSRAHGNRFDMVGTMLLAMALIAYALAMTVGRGHFDKLSLALLACALVGGALFVLSQAKVKSPLVQLATFRNIALSSSLVTNLVVSTVMMTTLVVGPFYLSMALGLDTAIVGIVMSIGPVVSALSGILAGRLVDRLGSSTTVIVGLVAMAAGAAGLAVIPAISGLAGYIVAIVVLTPGYQLFQAANNTAVMANVQPERRGVISGVLNLSRNLGLVTGASVMGAVFSWGAGVSDIAAAPPERIAIGMQVAFVTAALMLVVAVAVTLGSRMLDATFGRNGG